jgi:hypothetical protein
MAKDEKGLSQAGIVIPEVLRKTNLLHSYKLYQVKLNWKSIMGDKISQYAYIKSFEKRVAVIGVLNPVWMNHLFMYKSKIIEDINGYCQETLIDDVRFVRSGKKPSPLVYETEAGQEEMLFPQLHTENIVLPTDIVEKIREETKNLPEKLGEKLAQLRFSHEKRKIAMLSLGYHLCPTCGRWLEKDTNECFFCRMKERGQAKKKVYDLLMQMPWLSLEEVQEHLECGEELYNEVRRDCIYRFIDKVFHEGDTPEDDLFLALFVTRRPPAELTEAFISNLTEKYRRKEHVSSYRRKSDD